MPSLRERRPRAQAAYWLILLPAVLMLVALYLVPLADVLLTSVTDPRPGLDNYALLFTSASVQKTLLTTLRIAAITTLLALLLGYLVAYAMRAATSRRQRIMLFCVLLPFWISVLVRSFAWLTLLGGHGVLNGLLMDGGLIDEPLSLVRNETGVLIGMVHVMLPYAILTLYANMLGIDAGLVAAARSLGASRGQAFRMVFLPLTRPGLIGAGTLVFILSLGFFVTPALLGGGKVLMIAEYVAVQINDTLRWGLGTMLATTLMISVLGALWALSRVIDVRRLFGAEGRRMNRLQTSGTVAALAWLVLSFLALPAFAVIPVSFTDTRYLSLPQEHLSLQHWRTFLSSREWLTSIWQSLWIAAVSTVMAVTAGTLCAVGCWRIASRSSERVRSAMILPLAVPTIVYALGIYRLYVALDLVGTGLGVVLAHAVTGLPYVVLTVSASLSNLDPRLEQAARGLGASIGQTLRHVILPNIVPGVLSGAIFAFIHSWDELIVVIFIGGRALFTLPRRMWDGINDNLDPVIAVVATGMILFTLLVLIAELSLRARRAQSPVV